MWSIAPQTKKCLPRKYVLEEALISRRMAIFGTRGKTALPCLPIGPINIWIPSNYMIPLVRFGMCTCELMVLRRFDYVV